MDQAAELDTLGDAPLAVITATREAESAWFPMQDDLAALSTNHVHRVLDDATHAMVAADEDAAGQSSQAILDVVNAVRTSTSLNAEAG